MEDTVTVSKIDLKQAITEIVENAESNITNKIAGNVKSELEEKINLTIDTKINEAIVEIKKNIVPQKSETKVNLKGIKNPIGKYFHAVGYAKLNAVSLEKAFTDMGMNMQDFGIDTKALSPYTVEGGGGLIPSVLAPELIDLLRNEAVVLKAQPNIIPVPKGNIRMPVLSSGSTFYFRALDGNKSTTAPTFSEINATVTSFAGRIPIPNSLIRYADSNIAAMIEQSAMLDMASQLDEVILRTGTGTNNTPHSLYSQCLSGQTAAITTSVTSATIETDLRKALKWLVKNNVKMLRPYWFMTPAVKVGIEGRGDTNNTKMGYAAELMSSNTLLGIPVLTTNNLTTSATQSLVMLVDMAYMYYLVGQDVSVRLDINGSYLSGTETVSGQVTENSVLDISTEMNFVAAQPKAIAVLSACTWDA